MKNNLPYFSHDNDARNHWKHKALRVRYGWEGYGHFWGLNELISHAENCELRVENRQIRADSAAELGLSVPEFNEFLEFLADPDQCGLIQLTEDGAIITDRTQEALARVMKAREWDRNRRRQEKLDIQSENEKSSRKMKNPYRKNNKAKQSKFIDDDDGDFQNSSRTENENSGTEISNSFTTSELHAALAKSAPRDLTISNQLLKDLTTKLVAAGLELGYVSWYGDYVRRQPNLTNWGGYFRAHFGELVDRYKAYREKLTKSKPPAEAEVERADPADIEKAFAGLPWHRPGDQKNQKARDGPKELPMF